MTGSCSDGVGPPSKKIKDGQMAKEKSLHVSLDEGCNVSRNIFLSPFSVPFPALWTWGLQLILAQKSPIASILMIWALSGMLLSTKPTQPVAITSFIASNYLWIVRKLISTLGHDGGALESRDKILCWVTGLWWMQHTSLRRHLKMDG